MVFAADIVWTGAAENGNFLDGGNWDGGVVPGSGDAAVFPTSGTLSVLFPADESPYTIGSIKFAAGANTSTLTIDLNGRHLNVETTLPLMTNPGGISTESPAQRLIFKDGSIVSNSAWDTGTEIGWYNSRWGGGSAGEYQYHARVGRRLQVLHSRQPSAHYC